MVKGIFQGVKTYFNVFGYISKLKLWKYFLVPMGISLLLAILIGSGAFFASGVIGEYISSFWSWEFGKETFRTISAVFGGLIIVVFGLIIFKYLILILSAPFMGPISSKIEAHITGKINVIEQSSAIELLSRSAKINSRNLIRELTLTLPILIISFIPIVGIISPVLLLMLQSYFAGFGNMDYTLERHYNAQESISFVKKHKGLAIGNGIVFILFLLIPVIGVILVMPFSVTAATIVTIDKVKEDLK